MTVALLCIDLVNDCVDSDGKLADMGFVDFEERHNVLQRVSRIQEHFREQGGLVIHARTAFSKNYAEHPATSPMLAPVRKKNALVMGTWGADFHPTCAPKENEPVLTKHRIGSFHRTRLELILRTQHVTELYIVGISTLGSVGLTAMEAHDCDFKVNVIKDGCLDKSDERHELGLAFVEECGDVRDFKDVAVRLTMDTLREGI